MQMKRYLAIDTSAEYLTVIAKNGETFVTFEPDCAMQHSVRLMDAVEETLAKAGMQPAECDFFCAVTGPGSFTGIRIGISTFYSSYYLARILPAFRSLHPGIRISIVEGKSHELESMAVREEVDFSLIPMPLDQPELVRCHILHQEQILFAIPADSPLRSQLHVSMSMDFPFIDLSCASQEPFIFLHRDQRFYATALRLCQDAGFSPDIVCELTNWDAINALIGSGAGVGFVPELVTQRNLKDVPVPIYCRIVNQLVTRPYVIAYKKERELSPAASDFLEFIQALFKE